jgi:hypothetical protein
MAGEQNGSSRASGAACPLCGEPLYGWIVLAPPARGEPERRVLDRCENCATVIERGRDVNLAAEWDAITTPGSDGGLDVSIPNRASLQAMIGLDGWAALDRYPGQLVLAPRGLELLAQRSGHRIESQRTPPTRRAQAWMWQTLLNGLTFHANFARELRARRLSSASAISRPRFTIDLVVTTLAAPLVALVSVPLELIATLLRRGGEMRAVARRG